MAYEPKTWVCGEKIKAEDLNNLEEGVQEALECCGGSALEHWLDGKAAGSVRSNTSTEEDANYSLGPGAVAEGGGTQASGAQSHAEGGGTQASGQDSHAEGGGTTASGAQSHAEGNGAQASGAQSHAEGEGTTANCKSQHVFGEYNVADANTPNSRGTYVEMVGNGTMNSRSNARTLDWNGNEKLAGGLTLGMGTSDEVTVTATQLKALIALLNA